MPASNQYIQLDAAITASNPWMHSHYRVAVFSSVVVCDGFGWVSFRGELAGVAGSGRQRHFNRERTPASLEH
jgi:hypothetical protein